nr:hypothetical protein GCM10020241_51080 [Streptoalloteichus tenebrarius]
MQHARFEVTAVRVGVGASLFHHEHLGPQPEQRVQRGDGELVRPGHVQGRGEVLDGHTPWIPGRAERLSPDGARTWILRRLTPATADSPAAPARGRQDLPHNS